MAAVETLTSPLSEEDGLRAQLYKLLAFYLRAAPDQAGLNMASELTGDDTPLGDAISALAKIAGKTQPIAISQEYHDLFIGVGRGELLPYGSYYLTGFLHEKPLAKLRADMAKIGITRQPDVKEPEDHIAAECEMMAGLIEGVFENSGGLEQQKEFYKAHLAPWARHFFADLEGAKSSVFYAALGGVGKAFFDIEEG
ncbi:MAG: TorD/DmsD family molecular chaperone, partial [Hyphomicrobiales bacterium]